MGIKDRIDGAIDEPGTGWSAKFGDRLKAWFSDALDFFVAKVLIRTFPPLDLYMKVYMTKVQDDPNSSPEQRAFAAEILGSGEISKKMASWLLTIIGAIPGLLALGGPQGNHIRYGQDKIVRSARLDPLSVITGWRRDPGEYEKYFDDLRDQGYSDDRIEALKFVTQFMPGAQDLVMWTAREVFEPAMVTKYGLDDEFGNLDLSLFAKIGVTEDIALNYWRAHWQHASWNQILEMLHRGLINETDVREWFRLVEIPPHWRQLLIDSSWNVPTRVDVRRFWDMRTIDEARLRQIYTAQGYHGADLDDYVLWTKVYVAFPDLVARWQRGWISLDEIRAELAALGMPSERIEEMIQTKLRNVEGERIAAERDLTKTDIYKGIKTERITRDEGVTLLIELGFEEDEAIYLLDVNIPTDQVDTTVRDRELTKSDLFAALRETVLTADEVRARLLDLRYTPIDADLLLDIWRAQIDPPAEPRAREASKADIVLGVKKGIITPEQGYLMLLDLEFTPEAATFILQVRAETSPFSPTSYEEFKQRTDQWRKAAGRGMTWESERIREVAAILVQATADVETLQKVVNDELAKITDEAEMPEIPEALKKARVALRRAEARFTKARQDYDNEVALHRQGV